MFCSLQECNESRMHLCNLEVFAMICMVFSEVCRKYKSFYIFCNIQCE